MSFWWWFHIELIHVFPSSARQSGIVKLKLNFYYYSYAFCLDKSLTGSGSTCLLSAAGVVTAWRTGVDFSWCSMFLLYLIKAMGKLPVFLMALTVLNGTWGEEDVFYCRDRLFHTFFKLHSCCRLAVYNFLCLAFLIFRVLRHNQNGLIILSFVGS